jgi:SSS family solute:Na+ symporter
MSFALFFADATPPDHLVTLGTVDYLIIAIYFAFVLGIGFYLKHFANTGEAFFMASREMTAWIAGLAFISANLGALELLGWAGQSYQYGILACHWYWIGAIPAMLFLGLVMMPFYYISKTHSVPGYLLLRFGPGTRTLSAITFAFMTVLMSGINMFAMAKVLNIVLGWNTLFSVVLSSITIALYIGLGGLLSAIFNEVLQFMLIWFGAALIPILGLIETGGWSGMVARIQKNIPLIHPDNPNADYTHMWRVMGHSSDNAMGIHWTGIVFGLGAVLSMGYWTTDFLVVQRVLTAKDLRAAKMAPIIGAAFKMFVPLIVILPGLLGLAVLTTPLYPENQVGPGTAHPDGHSYNDVLPLMLAHYCGPGLMGLGITALIAGFMSGMAGNVTAFSTVWTYDIYRPLAPAKSDADYVAMGRWCTIVGIVVSVGAAYIVQQFESIMDYVQALFSFFIAPLFGTVILGMLWKRATNSGGFWGLLAGVLSAISIFTWLRIDPGAIQYVALSAHASDQAKNMYAALWAALICVAVTVIVSLLTTARPDKELVGLVKSCTEIPPEGDYPLIQRPVFWATAVAVVCVILNIIFW